MTPATERVLHVAALVAAALTFAFTDHVELAATALGGALALVVPARLPAGAPAIVLGLAAATIAGGCTAAEVALAHKVTCDAAEVVCDLCSSGGER